MSSTERRKNCAFLKHLQLWNLQSRRINPRTRTSLSCRGEGPQGRGPPQPPPPPNTESETRRKWEGGIYKITRELDQNMLTCCVSLGVGVSLGMGVSLGVGVDLGVSMSLSLRGCEHALVCICCSSPPTSFPCCCITSHPNYLLAHKSKQN